MPGWVLAVSVAGCCDENWKYLFFIDQIYWEIPGSVKYSMAAMQVSFTTSICLGFVKPCIITIIDHHLDWCSWWWRWWWYWLRLWRKVVMIMMLMMNLRHLAVEKALKFSDTEAPLVQQPALWKSIHRIKLFWGKPDHKRCLFLSKLSKRWSKYNTTN